jgi:tetratricopeptide (TPR) repeat protein
VDDLASNQRYLEAALVRSESLNDKATEIALLAALAPQFERQGDYYRQLTEYEEKRLRISREIGHRYLEGMALMHCGQVRGLYLGDYEAGLSLELEALHVLENVSNRPFPLLRIAQIHAAQGQYDEAQTVLARAQPVVEAHFLTDLGRAGFALVTAILHNALGESKVEAAHLWRALEAVARVRQMVAENLVSRQYHMAAACEAAAAHLGLARILSDEAARLEQRRLAVEASQLALSVYQGFGFVQIVECLSEEILFRHSQALTANGRTAEAAEYLGQAHTEMMRKHAFIPAASPYHTLFLEGIALHREIRATWAAYQRLEP